MLVLVAPAARAETEARRVHLTASGPCTDGEDFWARIHARTHVLSPAALDEAAPTLTITVVPSGEELRGTFRSEDDGEHSPVERVVTGQTCEEVASALSLVVALTYDRDALLVPSRPEPVAPSPPPAPSSPPPAPQKPPPPATKPLTTPSVGAHAALGSVDALAGGGDAFVEISRKWGALHPALRLSLALTYARKSTDQASATFVWVDAVPELCPTELSYGSFSFSPCAGVALGLLEATPSGIQNATAFTRPWVAPRVLVRSSYAVSEHFGIELEARLDMPLTRDRFAFGDINAYRAPPFIPSVAVGFSYGWRAP